MNVHHVVASNIVFHLANSLQEWKTLDITNGSANFSNDNVGLRFAASTKNTVFDFIGNMRDYLNGPA
ncbi:hypothetical protein D3C73_953380 [compost metagenome]